MIIRLNGAERDVQNVAVVGDLIAQLDLPARTVLVEHNGIALRREEWNGAFLKPNDQLEIIRIVAGG